MRESISHRVRNVVLLGTLGALLIAARWVPVQWTSGGIAGDSGTVVGLEPVRFDPIGEPGGSELSNRDDRVRIVTHASQIKPAVMKQADLKILVIGNSHTSAMPEMLGYLILRNQPTTKLVIARSAGGFLIDHARNPRTLALIKAGPWDVVILQAQKYSTSGRFEYPDDGAMYLSELAKGQGARIIMFPEWSQRGRPEEYKRIHQIHQAIADKTGATVAPIGQTWQVVQTQRPKLEMYASDGNHASLAGHYVNASVFYDLIIGQRPVDGQIPNLKSMTAEDYDAVSAAAWQQVQASQTDQDATEPKPQPSKDRHAGTTGKCG